MTHQPLSSDEFEQSNPDAGLSENKQSKRLPPGQQLVAQGRWPYVGERLPLPSTRPWTLTVDGLVDQPGSMTLSEIGLMQQTEITTDIHCVTRWSKFDACFSGVLLEDILRECNVNNSARFVSFVARSDRKHSSSLPLDEALELGTLLATGYQGSPLPDDHGGPIRGIVPGKYFYKSVKWIERIELLEQDRPGYWEAESGYHNVADPWREERYIAGSISKREAATLIESRNFSGRDLLSIDVSSLVLNGLLARAAALRNANFSKCHLIAADFEEANLSNANFRHANLQQANFRNADVEGADFAGADLRGVDFSGSSFFGTTFCDASQDSIDHAARLDRTTQIDPASLTALTGGQREFIGRFLE